MWRKYCFWNESSQRMFFFCVLERTRFEALVPQTLWSSLFRRPLISVQQKGPYLTFLTYAPDLKDHDRVVSERDFMYNFFGLLRSFNCRCFKRAFSYPFLFSSLSLGCFFCISPLAFLSFFSLFCKLCQKLHKICKILRAVVNQFFIAQKCHFHQT